MENGLKNLDEVVVLDSFKNIKSDYDLSLRAYYFAELINKNIEDGNEDIKIFKLFKKCLEILDKRALSIDVATLFFEIQLLKELGYFPELPLNPQISDVIKKLLKVDFKDLDKNAVQSTGTFIKNHIYSNLNESFKSLEL